MTTSLYLSFVLITIGLIAIPGPSIFVITSNTMSDGLRSGMLTVAGTNVGMLVPLVPIVAGVGSLATRAGNWFEVLRWAGVAYLAVAGLVRIWQHRSAGGRPPARAGGHFWEGFVVSLTNPTTTPFLLAFLPQFVDPERPALRQLAVLGLSFLAIALCLDTLYALLASRLGRRLNATHHVAWRERIAGLLMLGAALGLGLARQP